MFIIFESNFSNKTDFLCFICSSLLEVFHSGIKCGDKSIFINRICRLQVHFSFCLIFPYVFEIAELCQCFIFCQELFDLFVCKFCSPLSNDEVCYCFLVLWDVTVEIFFNVVFQELDDEFFSFFGVDFKYLCDKLRVAILTH